MQELKFDEVEQVSGGFLPYVALAIAIIVGAEQLEDFGRGLYNGWNK
ncbi:MULTISPECIES: class IIb bacteriocin, lactobin A/cerein 7B family [unclassified Janthinobacterium]|nr:MULTISPECIES: class IIb bacteriocin, lactobin A/cerein 7B family [unclassified Janthinobacterium]MBB5369268.1 lactobin A/cerein 7B family class IIb bacteriocin [Janthinobacterium sp. K2C7]MBB5381196.1 lactobin A/cerein 7B family class IIb bacteriocin [Janthinobacterium sp. K2Li3]MBB5387651.1 lactobin A/cerein 7B family class IIb bacteriocin [Janthinobacterium sp. K2E3]